MTRPDSRPRGDEDRGRVHLLKGTKADRGGFRATCSCGYTGPREASRELAVEALRADHGWTGSDVPLEEVR